MKLLGWTLLAAALVFVAAFTVVRTGQHNYTGKALVIDKGTLDMDHYGELRVRFLSDGAVDNVLVTEAIYLYSDIGDTLTVVRNADETITPMAERRIREAGHIPTERGPRGGGT